MGTRAEVADEPLISPIPPQDCTNEATQHFSALSLVEGGVENTHTDALPSDPIALHDSENKDALHSSAAAFVEGGVQEACDDSCSICLEPFCDSDPATVTSCKHDYHLQCILEWAQRSKDCPMCWRPLSFEDPNSQELFDAVERERSPTWMRHSTAADGYQFHQVPAFANYADFEERIMQHLAHQLARRGSLQNRISSMHDDAFGHPSNQALLRTTRAILEQPMQEVRQTYNYSSDAASHGHATIESGVREAERQNLAPETAEESQQRTASSDISSLSESLKSRFMVASSRWKETFTKTTHGFKEKWRARSNSTTEFRARAQEVSADVVRQAIKRIAPDSSGKDNDVPTTSSSSPSGGIDEDSNKVGACSRTRCTPDNHMESVAANGVSIQTPGEAVKI
eukprot:c12482_g1_i1 orf=85-1281(+)